VSGLFNPLPAPFSLHSFRHAHSTLRSAPFSAPLTLLSHALHVTAALVYTGGLKTALFVLQMFIIHVGCILYVMMT